MDEGVGVAGVGHAAGADVGAVVHSGGDASSELGAEGSGASNKGRESNDLHGYRKSSELSKEYDTRQLRRRMPRV